jgi:hypothetical protein
MDIIRPTTITDTILTSSTVAETDYSAWSSGTTYASGDHCIVTTPNVHKIYISIQNANTNHDPVTDCALATPLWWNEVSATNRWKVFDDVVGTQTSQAESASWVFAPGVINAIALLNIEAASYQVTMTNGGATVYDTGTVSLATAAVIDAYTYFFEPTVYRTDIVLSDLPPYVAGVVTVTLTNTGGTVKCGGIIMGMKSSLGTLLYGLGIGITDYSKKTADDNGYYTITEGAYSKRLTATLRIPNTTIDEVIRVLAVNRATPLVWVASETYASTIVYGFYRDFSVTIPYPDYSDCSIEIEGMI